MELLKVMSRLTNEGDEVNAVEEKYLSYFLLCREMGVRAVDGMVRGRVLELRWTESVKGGTPLPPHAPGAGRAGAGVPSEEGGAMEEVGATPVSAVPEYDDMDDDGGVVGPKLFATTPIMRYAMREVVQEYQDDQSVSEYASLSDPEEY